jgi:cell division protein FtsB
MFAVYFGFFRERAEKVESVGLLEKEALKVDNMSRDLFFTIGDGTLTFLSGLGVAVILTGAFWLDLFVFDAVMKTALVVACVLLGVFLFSLVFGVVVLIVDACRRKKLEEKKKELEKKRKMEEEQRKKELEKKERIEEQKRTENDEYTEDDEYTDEEEGEEFYDCVEEL